MRRELATKKPPPTAQRRGQWGQPEDIMKVKGIEIFIMLDGRLAKSKNVCQQKSGAEAPQCYLIIEYRLNR